MLLVLDLGRPLRRLAREPFFTAVTVLTLGLGIGAATAVYSVVDGVLLEPLPYDHPGELTSIFHAAPGLDVDRIPDAIATHLVYREASRSFSSMALHAGTQVTLTEAGDPARLVARRITPSLFQVLRVSPALGRAFTEEEGRDGSEAVAILSHRLWAERFGSDPQIVNQTVALEGQSARVVGVMPEGFAFPSEDVDLWLPLRMDPTTTAFGGFNEEGIGRLAPGTTTQAAEAELQGLLTRVMERFPDLTPAIVNQMGLRARVRPYMDDVVGEVRTALWVLLGTVGFVLFIACANVANLVLVRAEGRRREMAVRSAVGADQADLLVQHLRESLSLAATGTALGLVLAWQGLGVLRHLGAGSVPRLDQVGLDGSVLLFSVALTAVSAVAFALIPLLRNRSLQPAEELRSGDRSSTSGKKGIRTREILVAVQVALALVLLVGSGLLIRTLAALQEVDPGFETQNVLTFHISLPASDYESPEAVGSFHRQFLERLRGLPGAQEAGAVSRLPLGGMSGINGFYPVDDPPGPDEMAPVLETRSVTPGYFEALGIPLLQGRGPLWSDGADGQTVIIASQKAVEALLGAPGDGGEADFLARSLGTPVVQGVGASEGAPSAAIVGVVGDVHNVSLVEEPMGTVYYAPLQGEDVDRSWLTRSMDYAVRTTGAPLSLVPGIRQALRDADPRLPLSSVRAMQGRMAQARARTVFTLTLLSIASIMGLILGSVGLYGVISQVTARRTRELGLRMALGAQATAVQGMVLLRGLLVTGVGILAGLGAAWVMSRSLQSLLYGVAATDPLTYAGVSIVLLAVALLATWLPAHRASRVDVVEALRSE